MQSCYFANLIIACSRLRDSGEKSFSKKKAKNARGLRRDRARVLFLRLIFTIWSKSLAQANLIKAMFTLYRIAFAPARKPYQILLLFTQKNGDLGVVSVMERSCSRPIAKVESHISDRCSYYNWYRYSCRQEKLASRCNLVPRAFPLSHFLREKPWGRGCGRCSVNIVLTYRFFAVLVTVAVLFA